MEWDWSDALSGEMLVCGVLGRALFRAPDKAWLDTLIREEIFTDIPFAGSQPDARGGLALLREWSAANADGLNGKALDELETDYNHLFVGPGKLLAAPWESVYIDRERLLFQRVTLEVKGWYERFGIARESGYNEPEDHVGLELGFLAHLARETLGAWRRGDHDAFGSLLAAQREFVGQHPRRWIPNWCRDVEKHAATPFYRGIGRVTRGVVKELDLLLGPQK